MNCPSRTEELPKSDGMNQSPSSLSADLTTRHDFNGRVNTKTSQDCSTLPQDSEIDETQKAQSNNPQEFDKQRTALPPGNILGSANRTDNGDGLSISTTRSHKKSDLLFNCFHRAYEYGKFVGPGFLIAVAYIDPGNYSTDVAAGAATEFKLLFIVLMSNIFAITLQTLAVRLGTVTGMNLAEHCREHFPKWLNIFLYILGEGAIIATDIAEVIGSTIALNLLLKIPLVAGCFITAIDVLVILIFYNPKGKMTRLRAFEYFVMMLVLGVVICFCIELSLLTDTSVKEVFRGYLPSSAVVKGKGIYLSCGILGATVMPHSLYLGSGLVQARLREYDIKHGIANSVELAEHERSTTKVIYAPSHQAIKACMRLSIIEMAFALFTFALFVNSAILIVAGASLSSNGDAEDADLFAIHDLLARTIAPVAGTIFALALLLSGTSAGIVCTIAGQMLSEGALNWTVAPWIRRLLTRSISIVPSVIIAGSIGRNGLTAALNASQVALSVSLPFLSAPLIYFTCRNKYMVAGGTSRGGISNHPNGNGEAHKMRNHWCLILFSILIWLVIVIMNVSLLVLVGLGVV